MKIGAYRVSIGARALIVPALCMGYGFYQYFNVRQLPNKINLVLIQPVFLLMIIFTLWVLYKEATIHRVDEKKGAEDHPTPGGKPESLTTALKKMGGFVLLSGIYLVLIPPVGFIIANIIFMVAGMWLLGVRKWPRLIIIPAAATLTVYLLFQVWMDVPVPEGFLKFLQ